MGFLTGCSRDIILVARPVFEYVRAIGVDTRLRGVMLMLVGLVVEDV